MMGHWKLSHIRIGEPWRHGFCQRCAANCLGERMSFFVRFERHRGDAPGAVATLTVPYQDRKHVAIESRMIRSGSVLRKRSVQPYQERRKHTAEDKEYQEPWIRLNRHALDDGRPHFSVARF